MTGGGRCAQGEPEAWNESSKMSPKKSPTKASSTYGAAAGHDGHVSFSTFDEVITESHSPRVSPKKSNGHGPNRRARDEKVTAVCALWMAGVAVLVVCVGFVALHVWRRYETHADADNSTAVNAVVEPNMTFRGGGKLGREEATRAEGEEENKARRGKVGDEDVGESDDRSQEDGDDVEQSVE